METCLHYPDAQDRLHLAFTKPTPERKYVKILNFVKSHPFCTNHEIAQGLGIKEKTYIFWDKTKTTKMVGWEMVTAMCDAEIIKNTKKGSMNYYEITPKGREILKSVGL